MKKSDEPQSSLDAGLKEALGPVEVEPSAEARRRWFTALPEKQRTVVARWALPLGAAAAVALILLWPKPGNKPPARVEIPPPPQAPATQPAKVTPTLWEYRRLALSSPERFEAVLDRHSAELLPPAPSTSLFALYRN